MVERACEQIKAWKDAGLTPVPISVNQSKMLFSDLHYPDNLMQILNRYDVSPSLITLEILEGVATNNLELLNHQIEALHALGFRISMDDFGNGYYFKVLYKDILYFSSQNKKVHLVLKDGQKEFNGKLKEIAKKIPGNFIQIHQSYLINFDYIEECSYESVKMKNGDTIPISQPYRKSVRKQLAERVWRDRE